VPEVESGEKIRILVVDDNPDTRSHVSRLLYFEDDMEVIGQAIHGRQGIEMAAEFRPHIVLMDINMPDMDGIAATEQMSVKAPYSQVIIMTVQAEQHYMKKAMAAGAREFQPKPFTSEELVGCVRRVYKASSSIYQQLEAAHEAEARLAAQSASVVAAEDKGETRVIAVYSPKGGIGTSTVAANLSVAIQQRYGDVALMDADLQFGDILVHLNTRPSRTMSDLVLDDGFDLELLPDVLLPHSSGLKLLLAPPQPQFADAVTPEMIRGLIKSLKSEFRAVVVDTNNRLDDKTMAVLDNADYILLLTTPELPAIKSAKLFLELFEQLELDLDRIGVVINSANMVGGIPPYKIEKILKIQRAHQIPYDPRILLAVNRGTVLTQQEPNTPSAQAIIQLAEEVGQMLPEPAESVPVAAEQV
jgi:pilus assembly protein CpaE